MHNAVVEKMTPKHKRTFARRFGRGVAKLALNFMSARTAGIELVRMYAGVLESVGEVRDPAICGNRLREEITKSHAMAAALNFAVLELVKRRPRFPYEPFVIEAAASTFDLMLQVEWVKRRHRQSIAASRRQRDTDSAVRWFLTLFVTARDSREAILGDLMEDLADLRDRGLGEFKVRCWLTCRLLIATVGYVRTGTLLWVLDKLS